ncbi:hypothetical protein ACKKBG_A01995 [Auxenochlorella protothecoides x Auxenochlorella symbiontica]
MDTDMPSSPPARLSAPLSPPGVSRTFYKRQLPCPPAIEFSSEQGKHIFAGALAAGGANTFFKLIEQFRTQDEPAFCGLASVAMVLNSLAIDPRRAWKGPWRWFHEEMLDCCHPLARVREEGVTLDQAACLAHCNGAAVEVYPSGCVSLGTFRDMVRDACASGTEHIIVAYCRADFGQTGDGHHSPVGAYSEAEDLVLILDTARFKYPPHWVPLPMLYRSMARIDKATGRPRGFMRLGHRPRLDSVLFTLDLRDEACAADARAWLGGAVRGRAPGLAAGLTPACGFVEPSQASAAARRLLAALAAEAPGPALAHFLAVRTAGASCHASSACTQTSAVALLLAELRSMPLHALACGVVEQRGGPGSKTARPTPEGSGGGGGGRRRRAARVLPLRPGRGGVCKPRQRRPAARRLARLARGGGAAGGGATRPALLLVPELEWRSSIENEDLLQAVLDLVDLSQHRVVGFEVRYLESQYQQLTLEEPAGEAPLGKALGSALLQRETGGGQQRQEAEQQAAGETEGLSEALHGDPLGGQDAAGEGLRAVQ